jgi:AcrR family transcriptional regulator
MSAEPPVTVPPARRGRPRSAARDEAILAATLRLMGEQGYARMSIDAVAAAAGVGKPTIYSRYRSKADLATAAMRHLRESGAPAPTGDLRADLAAQLRQLRVNATAIAAGSLVGTCLAEAQATPELLELFRERTVAPRLAILRGLIEDARRRGELRLEADPAAAAILLLGALNSQTLSGEPFGEDWEERIVDTVLGGLAAP